MIITRQKTEKKWDCREKKERRTSESSIKKFKVAVEKRQ